MSNYIHGGFDDARDVAGIVEEMVTTLLQEKDTQIEELNDEIERLQEKLEKMESRWEELTGEDDV